MEETCEWLNTVLDMVIFNSAESQMAQLIQELIIGRIEDKLVDFLTESKKLLVSSRVL